ncbi:SEC-C metal-binding domain-containing protein [Inconstantimicrobium mannanitabidum]|uniref:Uncharacterized protein n=1 Tax=Inconstantimicrobium mannanitabidum TaxID=1604901 RepID=A0ACB5RHB8_9CLOT|nr:SEC-C metal-binding domain-containing protein [Clostridium sp. TW13]GKX68480.1 hypothetical protein rsdtw13_37380 [Clostridium sp. TW13]
MSLYKQWTDMVVEYVKTNGEQAFWREYGSIEKRIYTDLLSNHSTVTKVSLKGLADKFETTVEFAMGFLDGINDSLKEQYDLEKITADEELVLDINYEELYANMIDAKADYLYELPQWEAIFSVEKRKQIEKELKQSRIVRNEDKIGRNDPCPCGSGKKYKKCCGK